MPSITAKYFLAYGRIFFFVKHFRMFEIYFFQNGGRNEKVRKIQEESSVFRRLRGSLADLRMASICS